MLWQVDFFQSEVYEYLFDNKCIVAEFPKSRITSSAFRNWIFQFVLFCIQFTTAKQERKEIRANTLQISQQMPRMLERYIDVKLDIVSYPPRSLSLYRNPKVHAPEDRAHYPSWMCPWLTWSVAINEKCLTRLLHHLRRMRHESLWYPWEFAVIIL